jgi:hypothetical protein
LSAAESIRPPGYYWYRSRSDEPDDPASSGDWVIVWVCDDGRVSVADISVDPVEMHGEWVGPLLPPS